MILAIGRTGDSDFKAFNMIREIVEERGKKILLFKQDECLTGESIFFEVNDGVCEYLIIIDNEIYSVDDFESILYLHPQIPRSLLEYKPYEHANFILHQFLELRKGIWTIFRSKKWVNDPWYTQIAENKAYQLKIASSVGFKIPDTIITSDPEKVSSFYRKNNGNIITKIVTPTPILDHVIYTNRVSNEQMENIDSVRMCPSIFQVEIEKKYELRITVVGDKIFVAKILSQEDLDTKVDWRKKPKFNDFSVTIKEAEIPPQLKQRIYSFMEKINLRYGCIDMVVTPDDEYIFLEINPSGQWYFVQMNTNMNIAAAIVDLII